MCGEVTRNGRIWLLLLAWLLFVGLSWADMFDLSDDIVLPVAVGQAVVDAAASEIKSGISLLISMIAIWICLPLLSKVHKPVFLCSETGSPISETPLYQRLSTYRI